ncbi:RloB domain-containing protein [Beggiatoa alba]|nr:RloB domain-containing protein [Beggiatoa alba]
MGADKLFHLRRARKLARRKPRRAPYDKVLIVCEGKKTEPNYFEELKDHYGLSSANVAVTGDCGSSPMSVVNHAQDLFRESEKAGDAFDRAFCVIDKDNHSDYPSALDTLARAKPEGVFEAIPSVPCFEYWLLLHFIYTDKPYNATGKKSTAGMVLQELKRHWPKYKKSAYGVFEQRQEQLEVAKVHAARVLNAAQDNDSDDNPSTRVHELVDYLQNLKNKSVK